MNAQNADQYLPLIQALKDGKLQVKTQSGFWMDSQDAAFSLDPENYRRKPEPLETWCVVDSAGWVRGTFRTEREARESNLGSTSWCRVVHMREVQS